MGFSSERGERGGEEVGWRNRGRGERKSNRKRWIERRVEGR
jgi:hypothetical protein